jgi:hypothetical protein
MVYFMRVRRDHDPRIKIGYAEDVKARAASVEYEIGERVEILGVMPGMKAEETALHRRFASTRIDRTEFFRPSPELTDFIDTQTTPIEEYLRDRRTVKIAADRRQHGMMKLIAEARGVPVADVLKELLAEPLEAAFAKLLAAEFPPANK